MKAPKHFIDVSKLAVVKVADFGCGQQKTLKPMGWTHVQDPANLTNVEWNALLDSWNASAEKMMQIWCSLAAPRCEVVVPLSVSYPPDLSVTVNPTGPPHRFFIEMSITFKCEQAF